MLQNPKTTPHAKFENITWFIIKPMKLHHQTTGNRGGGFAITKADPEIKLIAPLTLQENINHEWQEYETIASRILGMAKGWEDVWAQGVALGGGTLETAKQLGAQGGMPSRISLRAALNTIGHNTHGQYIPHNKIDNPLVYTTSVRRAFTAEFELVTETNPIGKDIYDIVYKLIWYSSPDLKSGDIEVDLPYIFSVRTEPAGVIHMPICALTSVQPDYQAPYVNGYPMKIRVSLTFTDLLPIFRKFLDKGYKGGNRVKIVDPQGNPTQTKPKYPNRI